MVLGITSIAFCWFPYLGLPMAIVGLILSILGQRKGEGPIAMAGLVCSIIGLAIGLIWIIAIIIIVANASYYYGW